MIANEPEHVDGALWESLTEEQRDGVLLAYEESKNEENLISFADIVLKYSRIG